MKTEEQVENEPEWEDDDDYETEEECSDCGRFDCICDYVNDCTCGAWVWGKNGPCHVADCICGRGL